MNAARTMLALAMASPLIAVAAGDPLVDPAGGPQVGTPEPLPVYRAPPTYPRDAAKGGINGFVEMELEIQADGRVKSARVIRASPRDTFEQAALDAIRKWRFEPSFSPSRRAVQRIEFKLADEFGVSSDSLNLPAEAARPPVIKETPAGIMLVPPDPPALPEKDEATR